MSRPRIVLLASLALLALALFRPSDAAAAKWCPPGLGIDDVTAYEIGFGTVLRRGDVNYLEGNVVHVDVKHSLCSWISEIKAGGTVLGTSGGIEPSSQYYQLVSTTISADGKLLTRIRLTLAILGLGD